MKTRIKLRGCDDSTYIDMDVTPAEAEFLARLSRLSQEISSYSCQPTLEVIDGQTQIQDGTQAS